VKTMKFKSFHEAYEYGVKRFGVTRFGLANWGIHRVRKLYRVVKHKPKGELK